MNCSICLRGLGRRVNTAHLRCKHHFHASCLLKWLVERQNNTCPVCRQKCCERPDEVIDPDEEATWEMMRAIGRANTQLASLLEIKAKKFISYVREIIFLSIMNFTWAVVMVIVFFALEPTQHETMLFVACFLALPSLIVLVAFMKVEKLIKDF